MNVKYPTEKQHITSNVSEPFPKIPDFPSSCRPKSSKKSIKKAIMKHCEYSERQFDSLKKY